MNEMQIYLTVSISLAAFFILLFWGWFFYHKWDWQLDFWGTLEDVPSEPLSIISCIMEGSAFVNLLVCLATIPYYKSSYVKHIADIMSIRRESEMEGSFFLGSGTIKDVQYYFYYQQTSLGVKLGKVEATRSYVIETDEKTPSVWEIKEKNSYGKPYNTIYVPTGTITTTFILN